VILLLPHRCLASRPPCPPLQIVQHDTYLTDEAFVGKVYIDLNPLLTRADAEPMRDLVIQVRTNDSCV
jgi:hypothetical protein